MAAEHAEVLAAAIPASADVERMGAHAHRDRGVRAAQPRGAGPTRRSGASCASGRLTRRSHPGPDRDPPVRTVADADDDDARA